MNQILHLTVFFIIIATAVAEKRYVNGVPVLVNQYQYDITTHHTPLKIKPEIIPYPPPYPYPNEIPIEPHAVYGVPNAIDIIEPPQQPHDSYGVPLPEPVEEPSLKQAEPIVTEYEYKIPLSEVPSKPEKPALVYGVPEVPKLLPGKPAAVYGVPDELPVVEVN